MYCEKCGTPNEAGMNFCENCGAELTSEETISMSGYQQAVMPDMNVAKKGGKGKIAAIIAAAVVFVGVVGFASKDAIMLKVAPDEYVTNLIEETVVEIKEEMEKGGEELLGFNPEKDDFTVSLKAADLSELGGMSGMSEDLGFEYKVGVSRKDKELIGQVRGLDGDDDFISATMYLNDKEIGFNIPQLFDEYLVASSKEFGKQWNESELAEMTDMGDIDEDTDISFSKLFNQKESLTDETRKELKKLTKEFAKKAEYGDTEKVEIDINDKSVKAKKHNVTIDGDDLKDYLIDVMETVLNDENINNVASLDEIEEEIDYMVDEFKEYTDFGDTIDVAVYEYKGKAVKFDVEFEVDDEEAIVSVAFLDSDVLINHINITIEADGEVMEIDSEGNHVVEKNVFSDVTKVSVPGESGEFVSELTLDFKSGEFSYMMESPYGDEMSINGSCENKKGVSVTIEEIDVDGQEVNFDLTLSLKEGIDIEMGDTSSKKEILGMSESELEDYMEDIESEAMDLQEEMQEKIYGTSGGMNSPYYY